MKTTLKMIFGGFLLCFLIACIIAPIYAYAQETPIENDEEKSDWTMYLEEKVVPGVIIVVTAIGSIYIAISPVLSKVKKASGKFESATKDVNKTVRDTIDSTKKVANIEERLDKIEKSAANTEKIIRLGFCNIDEIVKKGYANEISKVGNKDEKDKLEV